ncbi:MAG: hypothetical protein JWM43_959 [Acidobacteriaceae bacterium]|nr:hypothetical protein [Acidobacteriaceae bacterium]
MRSHRLLAGWIVAGILGTSMLGQTSYSNPWAPTDIGMLPPVASLTEGIWLKGDLHVHSRYSKELTNNSIAKTIAFSQSVRTSDQHYVSPRSSALDHISLRRSISISALSFAQSFSVSGV